MRYDPIKRRLGKLEVGAGGTADAVLRFPDASTRAVSVRHPLSLFCAACARLSFSLALAHGTPEHSEPEEGARPASKYDGLIEMFGRASDIKSDNRFLYWIQDVCRQCIEEEERGDTRPRLLA
jgi:hypothetical protein